MGVRLTLKGPSHSVGARHPGGRRQTKRQSLMRTIFLLRGFLVVVLLSASSSKAADRVWVNLSGGSWHIAANWSPAEVPGTGDNAFITNNGTYTVTISSDASVNSVTVGGGSGTQTLTLNSGNFTIATAGVVATSGVLSMAGGSVLGGGDLTVHGALNWSAGNMAGTGRTIVGSGGTAILSGSATKGLNRTFENFGTVNYSGTTLTFGFGAPVAGVINNATGAVFNVTGDGDFLQSSAGAHAFHNGGTLNKTGGATDFSGVAFNNSGTVNITAGVLSVNSGGTQSGVIDVAVGRTLNLNGTVNYTPGSTLTGGGTINFASGAHHFSGELVATGAVNLGSATLNFETPQVFPNLTLSGGTLAGSANVTITNVLNWSAGNMGGAGRTIIATGATANFTSASTKGLNRTFDNAGTVNYTGAALYFGFGFPVPGVINNLTGAVFNVVGHADLGQSSAAAHAFNNFGTLKKSGVGTTTDFSGVAINNSGLIQVLEGAVVLVASGNNSGLIDLAGGTSLTLFGNLTTLAGSDITGGGDIIVPSATHNFLGQMTTTGTVSITGGTVNFSAAHTLARLSFSSGTLQGSGDVTVTNQFSWSAGTMWGAGKLLVAAGATGNITGGGTKGLNRTFENAGIVTYNGSSMWFGFGGPVAGVINNLSSGVFTASGEADFGQSSAAAHAFNNVGTFVKNGGGTTEFNGVAFHNSGTVEITSGTLFLLSGGSNTSAWDVPGGATLRFGGSFTHAASSSLGGAGAIVFIGGTHNFLGQFLPSGAVTFNSGSITIANAMPSPTMTIEGATVNFNAAQNISSLTFSSGALQGNGDVTITGTFNWSGGTMAGAGRTVLAGGATGSLTGSSSKGLNRTFDNFGTVSYSGNFLTFGFGAAVPGVVNNLAGGVFNVSGEADFQQSSAAAHRFNNSGTLNKSGPGTTEFSSVDFHNTGTLNLNSGVLHILAGGSNTEDIVVPSGGGLTFNGNFTHAAGSSISGAGTITFNGGTHNFLGQFLPSGTVNFGGGTISVANTMPAIVATIGGATVNFNAAQELTSLTFSSGTLQGSGNVTIAGTLNWSAGTMTGAGRTILPASATANFTGNTSKGLNRILDNSGTIHYSGNFLHFGFGASVPGVINNLAGGVFNANGEADVQQSSVAAHQFNNSGTFNKAGANTETHFNGVAFHNVGTVNLNAGTLTFPSGGANHTSIDVPAGRALNLGGNFSHPAGSTIGGPGTVTFLHGTHHFVGEFLPSGFVNFNGGTITITNTMPPVVASLAGATVTFNAPQALTSLTFSSGTLQGSGDVTIANTLNWSAGTMAGTGRTILPSGATAILNGNTSKGLNRTIDNSGTFDYSGNFLTFGFGASVPGIINNLAGGIISANGEADFLQSSAAAHMVRNSGTFNKSGGGTTDFSGVSFSNSNVVNVASGTLNLSGVLFPNEASLQSVPGGTLRLPSGNLTGTTTNAEAWQPLGRVLFDAGGSRQLEVMSRDLGNIPAGYSNNFAFGTLQLAGGVTLALINSADNSPGTEALYVDTIIVPAGTTFNLNNLPVYARNTQISGVVTNGTISIAVGEQFADLVVENIGAPSGASVGEVISVNWTVHNTTNASAETPVSAWQDRVVLSTDGVAGNPDDRVLATVTHNGALAIDASYSTNATVTLPNNVSGNAFLFVRTDSANAVYEFGFETNNVSAPWPIALSAPDLMATNLVVPLAGTAGGAVPVTWVVTNLGPGVANADWSDRIYLSTNETFDAGDALLFTESTATSTPLAANVSYTRTRNVTIPGNFIGLNYVLVIADATLNQLETIETNNVVVAPIDINASDLQVTDLDVTPGALMSGAQIVVRWTDTNSGAGPARGPWHDQIVVSNLTTGVKLVDTTVYYDSNVSGAISNGQSRARQYSFRLPDGPGGAGQLAFRVRTDFYNAVPEFNPSGTGEGNNLAVITRTSTLAEYPDLQVTNLAVAPASLQSGAGVTVTWNLTNSGNASVEAPFYESLTVRNRTSGETFVNATLHYNPAVATNGTIGSGQTRARSYSFTLPNGTRGVGEMEFTVTGDIYNGVFEFRSGASAEVNNTAVLVRNSILAPYPDLTVSNIVAPATGPAGQQVDVAWTVANEGDAVAGGSWTEQVFLANNALGSNALYLASVFRSSGLAAGAFLTHTARVTLPAFSSGNHYFVVRVDSGNQLFELNETNNAAVDEQPVALPASLTLAFTTRTFSEAAGTNASQGTIIRNSGIQEALDVTLTSSDPESATVPGVVTIPAGATSASFPVTAVDDTLVESNRTVLIGAAAVGFTAPSDTLTVLDNDVRALTLQVVASTVAENAGPVAALGYLSRNADTNESIIINLASDNPGKLIVPASLTMTPGQRNAVFPVDAVDNNLIDGTAQVKVQATASNYVTVATTVTVTDNDTVTLALSVADGTIAEGASSPATIGTVTRSLVNERPLSVLLSTAPSGALSIPSRVTIPANQTSITFHINAPEDSIATGARTVTLTGKALSDQGAVIETSAGSVPVQILDNDGPSLTVTVTSGVLAEGSVISGRVTRNTATTNALLVTLSNGAPSEAHVPASVTIPIGQTFVNFDIAGAVDGITDGLKSVAITASASGFNSGSASFNVSDIDMPDLRVASVSVVLTNGLTNGLTDARVPVIWQTVNDGLASAAGSWVDRIYLSKDSVIGNDTLLASVTFNGSIAVGQSYTRTQSVLLPSQPGNYFIIVETDAALAVVEGSERNNARATPLTIAPAYRAVVQTDVTVAPNGTAIPLRGRATNSVDGSPARFKLVSTRVNVMGLRRVIASITDGAGEFEATFQPLPTEAGQYTIGADHPQVLEDASQDQFTLLGMKATPERLNVTLVPNVALSGTIAVRNLGEIPLTGVGAVAHAPAGVNMQLNIASELSGMSTGLLHYAITSTITQQANATFRIELNTAEGATLNIPGSATIAPLRPQLTAVPAFLARGMLRDTQTVVSFDVVNQGGAPSGDLRVSLPAIPWLSLLSSSNVASLNPGERATVTLVLQPPADLPLTRYDGNLVVANAGIGVNVPFQFRAISEAVGDLLVSVTDEYTYFVAEAPKVTNATVRLRDAITGVVAAQGKTGSSGELLLSNIFEGPYTLEVSADKHTTFRGPVTIVPGITNTAEAFLSRQTVTYQWTVVPIEIEDRYRVELQTVFEAAVPIPNVIVETPRIMPLVITGEETRFEIVLRNEGLIAANNVHLKLPNDPRYVVTSLVEDIGSIPAKGTLTIPCTIRLRSTPPASGPFFAERAKAMKANPKSETCEIDNPIPCMPKIPISVGYYYTCGPNNVLQVRPIDLTPICAAKEAADCLEKIIGAAESNLTKGNLLKAPCDILEAVLECLGDDLSDCEKSAILAGCKTITGGFLDAAGELIDGCLCDLLASLLDWLDFDFPDVELSGGISQGGSWTPGFWGWFNASGNFSPDTCASADHKLKGKVVWPPPPQVNWKPKAKSSAPVCAKVRIRLEQEAVMTRNAFLGTLEIDNDGSDSITGIRVTLDVRDTSGNSVNERFAFRPPELLGLADVNGGGVIAAGGSGSAQYTFIPTREAAPTAPTIYQVGGTLRYIENGQEVVVPLLSATITVMPDPRLELIYFQQRDVYSDDPFTPEIEPAEPFALGLLVKNTGAGAAKNFRITSAQPKIIENEKGLLVDFRIIGAQVGTQAFAPSLTANLGTIPGGGAQVAQWLFTSTLQGKFIEYSASFAHIDSLGVSNLSLIDHVEIHELIRPVRAARPGDDLAPDFLVNDDPDPESFPDRLYSSDGTIGTVSPAANPVVDGPATFGDLQVQLTASMTTGWNYFRTPDPGAAFQLYRVLRSDGRELLVGTNVWTTDRTFPSAQSGVRRENLLHLLDHDSTGSYTLFYRVNDQVAPALLDIVDVAPNPQTNAVAFVDVVFSEPIDPGTFDHADVALTLDGGANLVNNSVTISVLSNSTYRISGLAEFTATDGNYQLGVNGSGIRDFGGNAVTNSLSENWAKGTVAPVIVALESVSPDPRNTAVSTLDVTFSQPINPATFEAGDITLSHNGGANLSGALSVAALSGTTFRISGLAAVTASAGSYALTIQAAGVQGSGGAQGAGVRMEEWQMDVSGPSIVSIEQLANETRSTVVQSLDVTFSEPIDANTFDYRDLALTRNGGANLMTATAQVTPLSPTTYRISNFQSLVGSEGAYVLTVNAAAISDAAGNSGSGSFSENWQMDTTQPTAPANIAVNPDNGISGSDGLINTNAVTLTGLLSETNLTVRIIDTTRGTDFGEATVTGTTFSRALELVGAGAHRLRIYAVDAAANVSADRFFDVFVDTQAPVFDTTPVAPSPRTNAVPFITVTSTEPLNTNTFTFVDVRLTRDGGTNDLITNTVSVQLVASNAYRINGLAALTEAPGDYLLTIDAAGIQDLAGNPGAGFISNAWQRVGVNTAPQLAAIASLSVEEKDTLTFMVEASDADVPTNSLTFSLEPGAPFGAAIDPTSGVFTWTPTEDQGGFLTSVTVRATDNGVPAQSSTRTFNVLVEEVNEPPALQPIANQGAFVGTVLNVLVSATDPDAPANQLTYSLAPGAPQGARIHASAGTFTWSPPPAAAGTTNEIVVIVTDDGSPPYSATRPFSVVVGDLAELSLGFTVVQAGEVGSVPVLLGGNVDPASVSFVMQIASTRLMNFSLANPAPQIGTMTIEPLGEDAYLVNISAIPGQSLSRLQPLASLQFTAVSNGVSGFVPLLLTEAVAYQGNGLALPRTLAHDGRVAVIATQPLLEALPSSPDGRTIVLHGKPGRTYTLECATNLTSGTWTVISQGAVTNQSLRFHTGSSNQTLFYRAREQ